MHVLFREGYAAKIEEAVNDIKKKLYEGKYDSLSVEEVNDELMLEIYEQTKDTRRA